MSLRPEDEVTLRRMSDLAIAPDGNAVVYAVSEVDLAGNRRTTRLWLWTRETGASIPLTTSGTSEHFPEWSPDGTSVAFIASDAAGDRLLVVPATGGRPTELLGPDDGLVSRTIFASRPGSRPSFAWSPDSRSIACLIREGDALRGELSVEGPRPTGDPAVTTEITERSRGGPTVTLCVLDLATRLLDSYGHAERPLAHLQWSPDGTRIYGVSRAETGTPGSTRFSLLSFMAGASEPVTVMKFSGAAFTPVLSPDGRQFAVSAAKGTSNAPAPCLLLVAADGTDERELSTDDRTAFVDLAWMLIDGSDEVALLAVAESGVSRQLVRMAPSRGSITPAAAIPGHRAGTPWIEMMRVVASGAAIALIASALDHPGDLIVQSQLTEPARYVTDINPHLGRIPLDAGRIVHWPAADGTMIEGILIMPPGSEPGKPVPLLTDYHGGPASHVTLGWNGMRQVFATAGYAVFAPNFRGGTGYGAAFSEALRGDIGGVPFTDSMSGVDYLIAEGIADSDRLGAYGHSWGGYMTNWTATQTARFRAIVSSGSICDLVSVYHTRYAADVWEWRLLGTPDESPEHYRKWSPIRSVAQVTTPVLILNGAEDRTTPPTQGLEMFTALRKHNVPAEYVVYPREGHALLEPAHHIDRERRVLDWFARHLCDVT